jgi:hypothetical protein
VFWKNGTDFSFSANGVTVIPAQAALALGVAKGKVCWPVVASLRRDPAARNRYCQTRGHARCVSGEAHVQSAEMRAYFDKLFSGKKKRKDFERGRDLDGPDRDYTSKGKAAKLASELEAELRAIPPGWPPALGKLGERMAFPDGAHIVPGYNSAEPDVDEVDWSMAAGAWHDDDAAGSSGELNAAAAMLSLGAAKGDGASRGGGKGGGGRGAKGGGKARGGAAKGGGKAKAAVEAGDGKGKGARKGGKGGGKGGTKGGAKGRGGRGGKGGGRARVVAFASGVAGAVQSAVKASRAAVPILLAPLATSYSKIILYVLAISATSAPSLLRVTGGFLYKLGVVSYTIRILMYPACILHVSCMYLACVQHVS